ncbi:BcCCH1, calcium channel protein [Calycina marina]|uniref:Calcium-channel protein CCH1 n=1 Tax=Calycina marina TaxID=1763456 RepID=A0A9P8CFG2_9HELO|nr:BcCCH1, calcium channel protein [Calycina marina]
MAPDPENPSTPPQSILLRDLSRPPDSVDLGDGGHREHSRGRSLLSNGSHGDGPRYDRLQEESSPSPLDRVTSHQGLPPLQVQNTRQNPYEQAATPISPVGNPADFQTAMGFAGLLVPDISLSEPPRTARTTPYESSVFGGPSPYGESIDDMQDSRDYEYSYFASESFSPESDRIPLNNIDHLQPISGAQPTTPNGQPHDRSAFRSVSFSTPSPGSSVSRLGDDLHLDGGGGLTPPSGGRSRSHSYRASLTPNDHAVSRKVSTSTAFSRAGSIVRAMSQRVVNLSGEAELIEESARREATRASARHATKPPRPSQVKASETDRWSEISSLEEELEPRKFRKKDPLGAGPNYEEHMPSAPIEKVVQYFGKGKDKQEPTWQQQGEKPLNPLRGKSLGFFDAESTIRMALCDVLVYPLTEPLILILIVVQTVLLAVDASKSVYTPGNGRNTKWGTKPIDWALLALFILFTMEIVARVIVSGFVLNAPEYGNGKTRSVKAAVIEKYQQVFRPQRQASLRAPQRAETFGTPDLLRSFTAKQGEGVRTVEQAQRLQLARRAFLRHSFNRLDLLAVTAFWIAFVLSITGLEDRFHIYVFRMISCLRILRLLALTHGTAIILRSLKKAAPLLLNVSFLIGFFWLLFAIIGVQSFKSSLDRQCVWVDPTDPTNNTGSAFINSGQYCGGHLNSSTGLAERWVYGPLSDLTNGDTSAKGFLCPRGSLCVLLVPSQLPYNGTVSFDNIAQSLELVFVTMTANTFSDIMYYLTDSDYLAAALFFAGGIVVMTLWLLNLLIAVITSSFQVIREEGKMSAFASTVKSLVQDLDIQTPRRLGAMKGVYDKTYWFWIIVIAYGLVCQALRTAMMSDQLKDFIDTSEMVVTLILLFDIGIRFSVDWRGFQQDKKNWFDLGLAIVTAIILIPPIRSSGEPYAWLTVFQILRVYRVIIAVPVTRSLITLVLGNSSGIANLMLFVFLITFLMSILAVQLFRGELDAQDSNGDTNQISFFTIYNAFLGMYQVMSSENWTAALYSITAVSTGRHTAWIAALFFIGWFILSNFILINMFIAVIQENFDVSEDEKRMHQVKSFLHRRELGSGSSSNLSLSAIFRFGNTRSKRDPLDYGPATMEMLLKDAVVKDFLDDEVGNAQNTQNAQNTPDQPVGAETFRTVANQGLFSSLWSKFKIRIWHREPNPFYSNITFSNIDDTADARTMAREAVSQSAQRKKAQREFLARHPNYNNAFFLFKPTNPIRRMCQRIVGPGRGSERFDGVEPNRIVWYIFSAFIYCAIVAMVLLACITTPLYQKRYYDDTQYSVTNWFVWADLAFAVLFTVEALIKVIADGLFWTPNAYFRSSWGAIDFVVLVTFWINVIAALSNDGSVSRAIGAFKALRALRLLNVSDSARDTFHSLIVVGGWKVVSAGFVSLSLLIPFAIYGVNLFNGTFESCNDTNDFSGTLANCFGEYSNTVYSDDWPLLSPRVVANPWYSFDDFPSSLFILFQIVSQEGWTTVMWGAQSITGRGIQPQDFASQGNAVFFVIFNLLATVFVLTLFISVFMRSYTEQTGVAFLTSEQRSWLELRKLLKQVSPSKRPSNTQRKSWKDWCYKRAVRKHGRWQRTVTFVLVLHLILLMIEYFPEPQWWDDTRTYIFLAFTTFYACNCLVRVIGLSWSRFSRSSWDVYSVFAIVGTFATTIILLVNSANQAFIQAHKMFLVSIVLLLIPRNDALDQLFKTAAASLANIGNLLATWFVLFLVFAIALTQTFGLTRFGPNGSDNINFRTVPKTLVVLFRMSCGEGWNQIMEDFATIQPPLCVAGDTFFDSDCGSLSWARALFILWNIVSMYIFTSLFVSLIYESFSYVYQHSSGLGKVSREEIRRFKQAWATLDPEGTGFITKEQFPRLLGELSGVFEMRIYTQENSVRNILEDVQSQPRNGRISALSAASASSGINIKALNKRLNQIDPKQVQRSRARYNMFFEEVMVSADVERGISFTTVLMILAHYNVISDNKSLKLEEFLRRRARLQRVEEEVRRRIVLGFFDTMYWSRKFRKHMERKKSGRMTAIPQLGPEVYVDDRDVKRQASTGSTMLSPTCTPDPCDPRSSFITYGLDGAARQRRGTETSLGNYFPPGHNRMMSGSATGISPGVSPQRSPQISPRHLPMHRSSTSAFSFEGSEQLGGGSVGSGPNSRPGSVIAAENVLQVLDESAWGESIRRSFTMRRPGAGSS